MNTSLIQELVEDDGIVFLTYGGFLTQALISAMTEALEKEAEKNNLSLGVSNNIFTIFIELTQNMMNYSKNKYVNSSEVNSEGLIFVTKDRDLNYYIHSQNIIALVDKEKIEPKLEEIQKLNYEEIKLRYRELRRSGRDCHGKGGGIGFYEIAKRSNGINFEFKKINEDKYYFHFTSKIITRRGN
ncbi:MAG: SiaB family protein kinase [Halarcobacter sp.]